MLWDTTYRSKPEVSIGIRPVTAGNLAAGDGRLGKPEKRTLSASARALPPGLDQLPDCYASILPPHGRPGYVAVIDKWLPVNHAPPTVTQLCHLG